MGLNWGGLSLGYKKGNFELKSMRYHTVKKLNRIHKSFLLSPIYLCPSLLHFFLDNFPVMSTLLVLFSDLSSIFKAMVSRIISQLGCPQSASGGGSMVQAILTKSIMLGVDMNEPHELSMWTTMGLHTVHGCVPEHPRAFHIVLNNA